MKMIVQSKLVKQLQILSEDQFKSLEKWLKSPWCNSNKTLVTFYQVVKPYFPDFEPDKLTKEKVFSKLYPGKPFNTQLIYNLLSEFFKQVEMFQAHDRLKHDEIQVKFYLSETLLSLDQPELFKKKSTEVLKALEEKEIKDVGDYYQLIAIYEHLYKMQHVDNQADFAYEMLNKFNENLDQFYLLAKSRFLIEAIEGKLSFDDQNDLNDEIAYLDKLQAKRSSNPHQIYQTYFKKRDLPSKQWLTELEEAFLEHFERFPKKDQKILLSLLINENARLLREEPDQTTFFKKAFELYKHGLEHDLLLNNGQMPITTYVNIVSTSNFLKKIDFSKNFIEAYYPALELDSREDVYDWARVHLAFNTGDPQLWTLTKPIIQAQTSDNRFSIRSRILLIQMWVEDFILKKEDDIHFILSTCQAFERKLERNKSLAQGNKMALKKFVQYAKKLLKTVEKVVIIEDKIIELANLIRAEKNLHAKLWLLQKIKDIRSKI